MTVKGTLSVLVAAATLLVFCGSVYYYWAYVMPRSMTPLTEMPPAVAPDNAVAAGQVVAVSAKSISITKQDGTTATFAVTGTTVVVTPAEGRPGDLAALSDVAVGALVLITPSADAAATARTIVLLPGSN